MTKTEIFTYVNKVVVRNADNTPCKNCGHVHPFLTKGCVAVLVPDQWQHDMYVDRQAPAPEGVATVPWYVPDDDAR